MPVKPEEYLLIGQITTAHGLNGALQVMPLTDDPERFLDLSSCFLLDCDKEKVGPVDLLSAQILPGKGRVLVRLTAAANREQALALRNFFLAVRRDQAIRLGADRWFVVDLIGCAVYAKEYGFLGTVTDLIQGPAQDVYVVSQTGLNDLLFPALKSILTRVDVKGKRIDVDLPAGLYEIYR